MNEPDSSRYDPDQSVMVRCPACGFLPGLEPDVMLGEIVWCEHCGAELEVVSIEPLRLDLFEEEEK
jgi:alpha-aminoadipate/glutamate carrier protein LysW